MLNDGLSLFTALGGMIIIVVMMLRNSYLNPLARQAIIASAFGLFMASRYAQTDHGVGAIIFTIGVSGGMVLTAVRHFQAYPQPL